MAITPKSGHRIVRRTIDGMEAMWGKMWDPPTESPATPELLTATDPVPAFMESLGLGAASVANTRNLDLLNGVSITTWDGRGLMFMAFEDRDFSNPAWPGPTIRVPRGVIYHADTAAKGPPPHTIHWHGIEPTPMNDGVGHCSMELGQYTYQWQPNFIGTYFYHCHRNTVQHFEMGLYGMLLIEPPDAFAPDNSDRGRYPRRTAANLTGFLQFPGFVSGDSTFGVGNAADTGVGDPHAFTVPYDVEALWVLSARDSVWNDLADNARSFYPNGPNTGGTLRPGVDDGFFHGFFHDYNADYWFVTGVPVVPDDRIKRATGNVGTLDPTLVPAGVLDGNGHIVPALNSGVTGMQVNINAQVGQTILVRILDAAYNTAEVEFPMEVVIIAWDGRALGVPPFTKYNHPVTVPPNTPIRFSTARRFDALIRPTAPFNGFATATFFDTRGEKVVTPEVPLMTAKIPIVIED
jgi:FtsP/CotA-like multicopper oxidase with cupredoxin domain